MSDCKVLVSIRDKVAFIGITNTNRTNGSLKHRWKVAQTPIICKRIWIKISQSNYAVNTSLQYSKFPHIVTIVTWTINEAGGWWNLHEKLHNLYSSPYFLLSGFYLLILGVEGYCWARSHSLDTPDSVRLFWLGYQPVTVASTCTKHNSHKRPTSMHTAGFETHNPSKRTFADMGNKPLAYRDWSCLISVVQLRRIL